MLKLAGLTGTAALLSPRLLAQADQPTAPAAAPSPGHYRFKIGELDALAVIDGGMIAPLAQAPFGVGEPREKLAEVLRDHLLAEETVRLHFNVLLVRLKEGWVMIDSGCGPVFGPAGGRLAGHLRAAGIPPEQIHAIVISHLHGDHFGGLLDADRKPVFPNARLFLHRNEHAFWSQPSPRGVDEQTLRGVQFYLQAFQDQWQLVAGGDKLFDQLELLDAPGHTPGHFMVMVHSGRDQVLHWVDALHHHALSVAHPEWKLVWDVDPALAIETRQRVLDRAAADRLRIFGGHMPFPGLGAVRRRGAGFEYLIEPWIST